MNAVGVGADGVKQKGNKCVCVCTWNACNRVRKMKMHFRCYLSSHITPTSIVWCLFKRIQLCDVNLWMNDEESRPLSISLPPFVYTHKANTAFDWNIFNIVWIVAIQDACIRLTLLWTFLMTSGTVNMLIEQFKTRIGQAYSLLHWSNRIRWN